MKNVENVEMLQKEKKIMSLEGSEILKNNMLGQQINKIHNITFNKSLLLNKLVEIGLESKGGKTNDIINVKFSYAFDSDPEQIKKLDQQIKDLKKENADALAVEAKYKYSAKKVKPRAAIRKANRDIIKNLDKRKEKLTIKREAIRELLYEDGFFLESYRPKKDENRRNILDENGKKIYEPYKKTKYVYWFRSSSKALQGEVFFINEKLLKPINKWQQMGMKFKQDKDCKLIELEAYKSLVSSSLQGLMRINAKTDILVINDLESYSTHKCKLVKTDKNQDCYVEDDDNFRLKNTLFDGQALIDVSLMQSNPLTKDKGGVLLRNHMFKSFALSTNIELFMRERFGTSYDTATIADKYGRDIKVSNIKLITTENSLKWDGKFDFSMEDWCEVVEADNNIFGIVKTENPSKYGSLQRASYQIINSLDPKKVDIENILQDTLKFTDSIKNDTNSYINYLDITKNEMNCHEMLIDLHKRNKNIAGTPLFRSYKGYKIHDWKNRLKSGKVLIEGDNLIILGSPYVMLQHAISQVPHTDNVIDPSYIDPSLGCGDVCYTTRFGDGEEVAGFRSPHNSPNNIVSLTNKRNKLMDKYFNCTDNIICVNLIGKNFQDRANGSDQDSDSLLATTNSSIVAFAKESQQEYPTIVNCIEQTQKHHKNNMKSRAYIDNTLAKSKTMIGESSNVSQKALSWYMDTRDPQLADICCVTSVLAQCSIDNSKRTFAVDVKKQLRKIAKLDCMKVETPQGITALPSFWQYTDKDFDRSDEDMVAKLHKVDCMMCLLEYEIDDIKNSKRVTNVDMLTLLDQSIPQKHGYQQVQSIIDRYKDYRNKNISKTMAILDPSNKYRKVELIEQQKDLLIKFNDYITKLTICKKNMKGLITKFAEGEEKDLDTDFLRFLYISNKKTFIEVFTQDAVESLANEDLSA